MLTDEKLSAGMSASEAQRAARIELGGIEQVKEQVREQRLGNWVQSVLSDSRFAIRIRRRRTLERCPQGRARPGSGREKREGEGRSLRRFGGDVQKPPQPSTGPDGPTKSPESGLQQKLCNLLRKSEVSVIPG